MFVLPNEGIYNSGRKSFERGLGKTFPKVFPKTPPPMALCGYCSNDRLTATSQAAEM